METFLNKLENRFGRFAIAGLTRYLVAFNAVVFILLLANPQFIHAITLDPERVARGEIWRLVSYLFIPPTRSVIFIAFILFFMWTIGESIERAWGTFRFNLFYLIGMAGTTIASVLLGGPTTNVFLNASLFFAFATLFPDYLVLLFFVLPVKVKWLALISAVLLLTSLVTEPWSIRAALIAAYGNYLLFFGPRFVALLRQNAEIATRRARFQAASATTDTLHRCETCGATEISHPDRGFRVRTDGTEICEVCLAAR